MKVRFKVDYLKFDRNKNLNIYFNEGDIATVDYCDDYNVIISTIEYNKIPISYAVYQFFCEEVKEK